MLTPFFPFNEFEQWMKQFFNQPNFFDQQSHFEINDLNDQIIVQAILPGFDPQQIKLEFLNKGIRIHAVDIQKTNTIDENNNFFQTKESVKQIEKFIPIPYEFNKEEVVTSYEKNSFIVKIPKKLIEE